jgi:hypothetical protein
MAGLDPAIQRKAAALCEGVRLDGRLKGGHDEEKFKLRD